MQISGPLPTARAQAGDVALGVDLQVLQAVRLGHRQERAGAGFLLERRGGDLRQRDDVLDRAVVLGGQGGDRRAVGRRWP